MATNSIGAADEQEAAPAETGVMAIDHAERHADGDGGIDRVPAISQDFQAGLRRERMHRSHRPVLAVGDISCLDRKGEKNKRE